LLLHTKINRVFWERERLAFELSKVRLTHPHEDYQFVTGCTRNVILHSASKDVFIRAYQIVLIEFTS